MAAARRDLRVAPVQAAGHHRCCRHRRCRYPCHPFLGLPAIPARAGDPSGGGGGFCSAAGFAWAWPPRPAASCVPYPVPVTTAGVATARPVRWAPPGSHRGKQHRGRGSMPATTPGRTPPFCAGTDPAGATGPLRRPVEPACWRWTKVTLRLECIAHLVTIRDDTGNAIGGRDARRRQHGQEVVVRAVSVGNRCQSMAAAVTQAVVTPLLPMFAALLSPDLFARSGT